jgi:hypothetical protein
MNTWSKKARIFPVTAIATIGLVGFVTRGAADGPCDTVVDWKHYNSSFSAYHYDHNGGSHPEPNPLFVEADRWENQTNWHASLQLGRSWDHIIPDSEQAHQGCSHN